MASIVANRHSLRFTSGGEAKCGESRQDGRLSPSPALMRVQKRFSFREASRSQGVNIEAFGRAVQDHLAENPAHRGGHLEAMSAEADSAEDAFDAGQTVPGWGASPA